MNASLSPQSVNPLSSQMRYQIRINGHIDRHWIECFDNVTVTYDPIGETILECTVDHAALHGLLARLRDLGLMLLSVIRLENDSPE